MKNGEAGVSLETQADLGSQMREIHLSQASGIGYQHPKTFMKLAVLSRNLDLMDQFDQQKMFDDLELYFQDRLTELDSLNEGASVMELRDQWSDNLSRDDSAEAIYLQSLSPDGSKDQMRQQLSRLIKTFAAPIAR